MTEIVLGINSAYYESAACIIRDGVIVAGVEEERLSRVKHAKKPRIDNATVLPFLAIDACLRMAGVSIDEIDRIGFSYDPEIRLKQGRYPSEEGIVPFDYGSPEGEERFYSLLKQVTPMFESRYECNVRDKFLFIDHHRCHAASAFFGSPFENAAVLVMDGIGEVTTTSIWHGVAQASVAQASSLHENLAQVQPSAGCRPGGTSDDAASRFGGTSCLPENGKRNLLLVESLQYPHSIGLVWEKITDFLGFQRNNDEGKIMGLASYGNPKKFYAEIRKVLTPLRGGRFCVDNSIARLRVGDFTPLERLFRVPRRLPHQPLKWQGTDTVHADVAAALQDVTEEIVLALAARAKKLTGCDFLCMAGGVALNCVANGKLALANLFKDIWIQPAAHDAGTAIGAAAHIYCELLGQPRTFLMDNPFLGPEYSGDQIRRALERFSLQFARSARLEKEVADLVASGKVVGWFQGRLEIGPRALGNRSILANPTLPGIRDRVNRVKHREVFRPFCPSIVDEETSNWFETGANLPTAKEFMLLAYPARKELAGKMHGVLHVDGTGRIQSVNENDNPRFYAVLKEFQQLTGVPVLLNTSFNDQEPIVCSPEDAIRCFVGTDIDVLAIGDFLVRK